MFGEEGEKPSRSRHCMKGRAFRARTPTPRPVRSIHEVWIGAQNRLCLHKSRAHFLWKWARFFVQRTR